MCWWRSVIMPNSKNSFIACTVRRDPCSLIFSHLMSQFWHGPCLTELHFLRKLSSKWMVKPPSLWTAWELMQCEAWGEMLPVKPSLEIYILIILIKHQKQLWQLGIFNWKVCASFVFKRLGTGVCQIYCKKCTGVANSLLCWRYAVRECSEMLSTLFSFLTFLTVTIWELLSREQSMWAEKKGLMAAGCCGDRQHPTAKTA